MNNLEESTVKFNGFYRAKVIDAHDKKQLGRVKVWIPDLMPTPKDDKGIGIDDLTQGLWAHSANCAMGGRNKPDGVKKHKDDSWYQGQCLIPPKGSWVWIFFECGDPNHPYYFGSGEFGQEKVLPENQTGTQWEKKWTLIKTRMGRCIIISDDPHDCRVEITGKKRMITSEPNGDTGSVSPIDGNQTVILLDERAGHEKLLFKDYKGNFINIRTDDEGAKDQLQIFFNDDIHIETKKNLFIKTGEKMHIDTGDDYLLTCAANIHTKAATNHKEKALSFRRTALLTDYRFATLKIKDSAGLENRHNAGLKHKDVAGIEMARSTFGWMDDFAGVEVNSTAGVTQNIKANAVLNLSGTGTTNLSSSGPLNVNGIITNVQCGAIIASSSVVNGPSIGFGWPKTAIPALPEGNRSWEPEFSPPEQEPPIPLETEPPLTTSVISNPPGDPYDFRQFVPQPQEFGYELPPSSFELPPVVMMHETAPAQKEPAEPSLRYIGVGHMFTISLKDEYREKIIPLAKKSGATHTGFYLLRDLDPGADNIYLDDVSVWNNYRDPLSWDDWNNEWWDRFKDFLILSTISKLTVVPTLFDFCSSPSDPFITKISNPYTVNSWGEPQEMYVSRVVEYLNSYSSDNYIINLGCKSHNMNQKDKQDLLPSAGYIRKLIMFLVNDLKVSSKNIALTANSNRNLFEMSPLVRWKMYTGDKPLTSGEINNEEYIDAKWGGTGRIKVFNDRGELIGGYVKYLNDSVNGIPCFNTWKMNEFDDGSHDMNKMFHPNGRTAMREVLGITNDGSI